MNKFRWLTIKRQYAINACLSLLIFFFFLVLINTIASFHDFWIDTTQEKQFSLSDQSIKLVKNLTAPLKMTFFYSKDASSKERIVNLLNIYSYYSSQITIQLIDPDASPVITKQYGVKAYNTLALEYKSKSQKTTSISEVSISSIIKNLINEKPKTICFTQGHGEGSITSNSRNGYTSINALLNKESYNTKSLLLIREHKISSDCSVLIIAGPQKNFSLNEIQTVENYIEQGGSTFILFEPGKSTNLKLLVRQYKVIVRNDIIVDPNSKLNGGDYTVPVVKQYGQHIITDNFTLPTVFPIARSIDFFRNVTTDSENKTKFKHRNIVFSSLKSWGETDIKGDNIRLHFDKEVDTIAPVSIATVVERKDKSPFRLVVFGDSSFVNNTHISLAGNSDLFLNVINWLSGDHELISIRPKEKSFQAMLLTRKQGIILWVSYGSFLLLILASAFTVMYIRRK